MEDNDSTRRLTLVPHARNEHTASSRQLAARWFPATGVLMSTSDVCCTVDCVQGCLYTGSPSRQFIGGCVCNWSMSTEPSKLISTKLSFQRNLASICGTMMAAFVFHAVPVNAAFQSIPGVIFQQDNARPHVAKTVRDFCSAQHIQLLPFPAYSPDMLPTEQVWDLVVWRLARDPRPTASKDEFLLHMQAIWNSLPQADIQNLFDSMPRRIAARGGYTKYWFRKLNIVFLL
ncbi:transposable element Tcb2 transposase [Trichonephila clavipes]|nr:transposable element Tcb2 transposase [Trichonephila clavipes]